MSSYIGDSLNKFARARGGALSYLMLLVITCLMADLITNNQPIFLWHQDTLYVPMIQRINEQDLGGHLLGDADFNDPYILNLVRDSLYVMPPWHNHYSNFAIGVEYYPSPPSLRNPLGTDERGLDVLANIIYGLRVAIIFGVLLTLVSTVVGIVFAAITGYYGGYADLIGQRFLEVWSAMPSLYILIILASVITPNFAWLLIINLLFSWTALVYVVRAEFLKVRKLEYVTAARALGVGDIRIIFRHILPNAMTAAMSFIPFLLVNGITTISILDFLGLGMPYGQASLGMMIAQAKNNLYAPWILAAVTFFMVSILACLIILGNRLRDALDPRSI